MRRPVPSPARSRAFTLLEMMMVIVIIGIMTALILPEMKGTYQGALLRSTARRLVDVITLACSRAVTSQQMYLVRLDVAKGHYAIERPIQDRSGTGLAPLRDVPGGEGELDRRIAIEVHKADQDPASGGTPLPAPAPGELDTRGRGDVLTFYPDGTTESAEILLRDSEGFRLALRVNPVTARVRITDLGKE